MTVIFAIQGLAFALLSLLTPRNLDAMFITSCRSAAACSFINATAPSNPMASSCAHSTRYSAAGKFVFALAWPSVAMLTRS